MKIRSVTVFADPGWPVNDQVLARAGRLAQNARDAFQNAGYEVQTTRLATPPFPRLLSSLDMGEWGAAVQAIEAAAAAQGFEYTALGPAGFSRPEAYELIPDLIAQTENVFFSAHMAVRGNGISIPAVQACARVITRLAPQDPNGFANLYFTALSNVKPGSPFFPAAYHDGSAFGFALATEAASLAVDAFNLERTFEEGLAYLRASIERHGRAISAVGRQLEVDSDARYNGIDFSLAPFPEQTSSLGYALERMGVPRVGQHGSLAAAALLASTLDRADFPHVGFSGLLFPQLEDFTLAERAAEGVLSVKDFLMYSAVCGTGLDTIPLPGDTSPELLTPLLLDLAALGLRLDKPLTARLMPVPGKQAGEPTSFDFPFFANSRVMPLDSEALQPPLAGADLLPIPARSRP